MTSNSEKPLRIGSDFEKRKNSTNMEICTVKSLNSVSFFRMENASLPIKSIKNQFFILQMSCCLICLLKYLFYKTFIETKQFPEQALHQPL